MPRPDDDLDALPDDALPDDALPDEALPDAGHDEGGGGPRGRPIRRAHRNDMMDLKDIANRLADLPPGDRRALPFDEELHDVLERLSGAYGRVDRRRLVMRAKLLLGALDRDKLDAVLAGETPTAERDRMCVYWRTKLVAGDDRDLQRFIEEHPGADRQALRASLREARGTGPAATRAQARLLDLLREAIPLPG